MKGWTYVQRIRTGLDGKGVELKVMFDNNAPRSLILYTAAARAALVPVWGRELVISPDSGEPEESMCKYAVPLVSWSGSKQWLKARGVTCTAYAEKKKVPRGALHCFQKWRGRHPRPINSLGWWTLGKTSRSGSPGKCVTASVQRTTSR
jgi:hypothetical protein